MDAAEVEAAEVEAAGVEESGPGNRWPVWLAVGMLAATGVAAAYVSDLFVNALTPAMNSLHISQALGPAIVAIAGNAVENAVGVKLAWQNQPDHALSVILNSPLQIALVLAPGTGVVVTGDRWPAVHAGVRADAGDDGGHRDDGRAVSDL